MQVKTAMEVGETVILVNSAPIHSCFYDVFNRHFAVIAIGSVDDKKDEKRKDADDDDFDMYPSLSFQTIFECKFN